MLEVSHQVELQIEGEEVLKWHNFVHHLGAGYAHTLASGQQMQKARHLLICNLNNTEGQVLCSVQADRMT